MGLIPPTPWDDPEARQQKKFNKAMGTAIVCLGIGVGMMLIKPFFTGTEESAASGSAAALFNLLGLSLTGYGAFIVACGIFLRRHMPLINTLTFWLVLPLLILKALTGWQG